MTFSIYYIGKHRTATVPIFDTLRDRRPTSYIGKHRQATFTLKKPV